MKVHIGKPRKTGKQTIRVQVDKWDTWNADFTIATIAYPLLIQLQETKHGAPLVDDDDVPENIRACNASDSTDDHVDEFFFDRWDWVLNEMIWSMNEISNHCSGEDQFYDHSGVDNDASIEQQIKQIKVDTESLEAYNLRLRNGCRLFGKYFMNLWD